MTFADLAPGDAVFVDANILTYHFQPHARWGSACTQLLRQIENQQLIGYSSAHVLAEACHRLMTIEAHTFLNWPMTGIGNRLRTNPTEVRKLARFRAAVENLARSKLQVLPVTAALLVDAVAVCQQFGLLTNDGLIIALMQAHGLTRIASNDSDLDAVPGVVRYEPI